MIRRAPADTVPKSGESLTREVLLSELRGQRRVLIADAPWLHEPARERLLEAGVEVAVLDADAQLSDHAQGAVVVVTNAVRLTELDLRDLPDTQLIIRSGAGADAVDVAAASRAGMWVANVPDYCSDEVADHTLVLLMASMRRFGDILNGWRVRGQWNVREQLSGTRRVRGLQLGLVGFGRIGSRVGQRAAAFGWRVAATDPQTSHAAMQAAGAEPMGFDELLTTSDAISLHCPLTPATRHLIGAEALSRAKRGLVLVNTSRGGLVDLDALDAAIASGHVAAAGLDVLEGEPAPDLRHPILARSAVLVTPHVAWYSIEAREELGDTIAAEVIRFLNGGRPLSLLNPEARA